MDFQLTLEANRPELQSMAMPEMYNPSLNIEIKAKNDEVALKRSGKYAREFNRGRSDKWHLIEVKQLYTDGGYRTIACLSPAGRLANRETLKRLYNVSI